MERKETLHLTWNIAIILCVTLLTIGVPLHLLFELVPGVMGVAINLGISLLFVADIWFTIRRIKEGLINPMAGEPVTLKQYFRLWFIFDVLAAIPFSLIPGLGVFALLRLAKLAKVGQLIHIWRHSLYQYRNTIDLVSMVYWLLLSLHALACGWLYVRGMDTTLNYATNYVNSLYWSVTTITTVGYGDIVPFTNGEKLYAILTMIVGLGFFGYVIGYVAGILSKSDPAREMYEENLEQLSQTVRYRALPRELQNRIHDYYTYIWKKQTGYFETDFLNGLPSGLRDEVSIYLKKDIVEKVPLLSDGSNEFLQEISLRLKNRILVPDEYIFKAGDKGAEMYFVVRGQLSVISRKGEFITHLSEGDFFGEISLFLGKKRTATIKANTYCDVYSLSKKSLDYVVKKYPEVGKRIEKKIALRVARDKKMRDKAETQLSEL